MANHRITGLPLTYQQKHESESGKNIFAKFFFDIFLVCWHAGLHCTIIMLTHIRIHVAQLPDYDNRFKVTSGHGPE